MPRSDPQLALRVPHDVKAWLVAQAHRNLRSINNEVVFVLREKMARAPDPNHGDQSIQTDD